ncbi:probable phosphoenolpyruvate synthase [Trichonephila clavipes]|nr:probable phosphoenolpyruvate synthase [Trichonephila clavipes]
MFLAGHPSQGCFNLQSHCAPCYFFNQASFYPSDFSFKIVEKTQLSNIICQSITEDLKRIYGDEADNYKFAVRSSSTGEDTAAMSAAGQMETLLGVQGFDKIFAAVRKCWASQFGYTAIEYKRLNGQVLNSPMAVVIQEMVACEVAGVLFTLDPVTSNPYVITITANYGLGESVVSGSVEPDTIVLRRKDNENLELDSVVVGSKLQKIVMQANSKDSRIAVWVKDTWRIIIKL